MTQTKLPFLGWCRRITRSGGSPYLQRFSLFRQRSPGRTSWRVYIHKFEAPDDVHIHNHPFAWAFSIVLRGAYKEEIGGPERITDWQPGFRIRVDRDTLCRTVRRWNFIRENTFHRIAKLLPARPGEGVWTLFVAGPLARDADGESKGWGFWVPGRGYVDHDTYERERRAAAAGRGK